MATTEHTPGKGSTGPKGITNERIMEALEKNAGVVVLAAQALKCSGQNLRKRIASDAELLQFAADLEEDELDLAEGVIKHGLRKKDQATARWYLDRKGRSRGYRTTTELTGKNGAPIQHAVTNENFEPSTPEEIASARRRFIDDGDDEGA